MGGCEVLEDLSDAQIVTVIMPPAVKCLLLAF